MFIASAPGCLTHGPQSTGPQCTFLWPLLLKIEVIETRIRGKSLCELAYYQDHLGVKMDLRYLVKVRQRLDCTVVQMLVSIILANGILDLIVQTFLNILVLGKEILSQRHS